MTILRRSLAVLALLLFTQPLFAFYCPTTGRFLSRDPIGEQGGENLYAFVRNEPIRSIDILGRIESTQDSSNNPRKILLEKCTILLRAAHFTKGGPQSNLAHFKALDLEHSPACSRIGYIGCGANYLNSEIPSLHWAILPTFQENALDGDEIESLKDLGFSNEEIARIGAQENLSEAIDDAAASAKLSVESLCNCCDNVKLKIECAPGIEDWSSRLLDRHEEWRNSQDGSTFNWKIEKDKAKRASKCGKTKTYDCKSKTWSKWQ